MTLTNPTNAELNAAFATEVARITDITDKCPWEKCLMPVGQLFGRRDDLWVIVPNFCSDANAVLVWLEKFDGHTNGPDISFQCGQWEVVLNGCTTRDRAVCSAFPKAAVIALLRAHGVEII